MARKQNDTRLLSVIHPICCGLDVHKKKISACLITMNQEGKEEYEYKNYLPVAASAGMKTRGTGGPFKPRVSYKCDQWTSQFPESVTEKGLFVT